MFLKNLYMNIDNENNFFLGAIKYKTNFYLEKRKDKNTGEIDVKNLPIRMSFVFSKQRLEFYTGYRIDLKDWDPEAQTVLPNRSNSDGITASFINQRLTLIRSTISNIYTVAFAKKEEITVDGLRIELKKALSGKSEVQQQKKSIWEYYDQYIDIKKVDKSPGYIKQLKSTKKHLQIHAKSRNIKFEDFDVVFFEGFKEYYLVEEKNSYNSFAGATKRIKLFLNFAVSAKWTNSIEFRSFKANEDYAKPIFLTWDELMQVKNADMKSICLDQVRDCFIFQSMVGCRYEDLSTFTKQSVSEIKDKGKNKKKTITHYILTYIDHKTHTDIEVPLNNIAISIYDKYKNLPMDKLLPVISNQKYNDYLKDVGKLADLSRQVDSFDKSGNKMHKPIFEYMTSHMARRNFIGNMLNQFLIPSEIITSMTGHVKGSRAFQRYYEANRDAKISAISLMNKSK